MITTDTNKVIYVSDGTTTEYDFSFTVYNSSDVKVYVTDLNGNVSQLPETDYTVALNSDYTGKITLTNPQPANCKIAIVREVDLTQETHYIEGDPFPAQSHERALDKLTMITQQLKEKVDRALTLSIFDETSIDANSFYQTMHFCEINFDTYKFNVDNYNDIKTTADNISNINTVADNINNVNTVNDNIANVNIVSSNIDNVNTVANNIDNINITSNSIDNVNTYAKTYLGAKDIEPTTRNDGTALQVGDMYFDKTNKIIRVWIGTGWTTPDVALNVLLTDIQTGKQYNLFISDGNLGIEEV